MDKPLLVSHVKKRYKNKIAVDDISFSTNPFECVALLGANGAGKTSTLKMIHGANTISSGKIEVMGFDVKKDLSTAKKNVGIVSQEDLLDLSLNIYENLIAHGLCYGIKKAVLKSRTEELLKFVDLYDVKFKEIGELSGGMRRRLILARALLNQPKLIILDEPTTGLDIQSRHLIWDKLLELKKQGVSILLTSHYMDEVENLADRILIVVAGKIIAEGTKDTLLKQYRKKTLEEVFLELTTKVKGEIDV
nr:ABC transporter ATP-binding protein [Lactococcus allomyrinae]